VSRFQHHGYKLWYASENEAATGQPLRPLDVTTIPTDERFFLLASTSPA
jgi:hypothetical protein